MSLILGNGRGSDNSNGIVHDYMGDPEAPSNAYMSPIPSVPATECSFRAFEDSLHRPCPQVMLH